MTAEELLRELLVVNQHGTWFMKIPDRDQYIPLPLWMFSVCEEHVKNPRRI